MPPDEIARRLADLEARVAADRLRQAYTELRISRLEQGQESLGRVAHIQRTHLVTGQHPSVARADYVAALVWVVALAYGRGINTNTARAIRAMLEDCASVPDGLHPVVEKIRRHYGRVPTWETFWNLLKRQRDLVALE